MTKQLIFAETAKRFLILGGLSLTTGPPKTFPSGSHFPSSMPPSDPLEAIVQLTSEKLAVTWDPIDFCSMTFLWDFQNTPKTFFQRTVEAQFFNLRPFGTSWPH